MSITKTTKEKIKCSICNAVEIDGFYEYGNNAEPINNGECCNLCNEDFVIPARLKQIYKSN